MYSITFFFIPWRIFWLPKISTLILLVANILLLQLIVGHNWSQSLAPGKEMIRANIRMTVTTKEQCFQIEKILSHNKDVAGYQKITSTQASKDLAEIGLADTINLQDIVTFSIKLKSKSNEDHFKFKNQLLKIVGENPLNFSETLEREFKNKENRDWSIYWRYGFLLNFFLAFAIIAYIVRDIKKYFRISFYVRRSYVPLWLPLVLFLCAASFFIFIILFSLEKTTSFALLLSLLLSLFSGILVKKNEI